MSDVDIKHYSSCRSDYPEKPKGQKPQQIETIPMSPTETAHQCVDCGAFVIVDSGPPTTEEFRRLALLDAFSESDVDAMTRDMAREYHRRCDEYDKTICTVRRCGSTLPANNQQFVLINHHARMVFKELIERAAQYGIRRETLTEAIQKMSKERV